MFLHQIIHPYYFLWIAMVVLVVFVVKVEVDDDRVEIVHMIFHIHSDHCV